MSNSRCGVTGQMFYDVCGGQDRCVMVGVGGTTGVKCWVWGPGYVCNGGCGVA